MADTAAPEPETITALEFARELLLEAIEQQPEASHRDLAETVRLKALEDGQTREDADLVARIAFGLLTLIQSPPSATKPGRGWHSGRGYQTYGLRGRALDQ